MPDVHDKATRSRNMAAIRGKNTKPEKRLRSLLHQHGFRFRLNTSLPGKPDLTLKKYRAVIFVHGCFWHWHGCPYFKLPKTNTTFWVQKLERNVERDKEVARQLEALCWRRLVVWECALFGKGRLSETELINRVRDWLLSEQSTGEIAGYFG